VIEGGKKEIVFFFRREAERWTRRDRQGGRWKGFPFFFVCLSRSHFFLSFFLSELLFCQEQAHSEGLTIGSLSSFLPAAFFPPVQSRLSGWLFEFSCMVLPFSLEPHGTMHSTNCIDGDRKKREMYV